MGQSGDRPAQLLLWVAGTALLRQVWKPWYRRAMSEMGLPICAACGYNLSGTSPEDGSTSTRTCSECGWAWTPRPTPGWEPSRATWSEEDRRAMRGIGFETCRRCSAILNRSETTCPTCGSPAMALPDE